MPTVGDCNDPFPFPPYAVQNDAVTRLRAFLREEQSHAVAVLESPTGTGKSHVLLTSVLSHLFSPVYEAEDADSLRHRQCIHDAGPPSPSLPHQAAPEEQDNGGECSGTPAKKATEAGPTLEATLKQRLYAEELARAKEERKERVRLLRRRMREAQKRKAILTQASSGSLSLKRGRGEEGGSGEDSKEDGEFLLQQNPLDFLDEPGGESHYAFPFTSSSSSSAASSSSDEDGHADGSSSSADSGDDADGDEEASLLSRLTSLVPLRKPKAYIASRTHTQIHQLFQDLLVTDFVRHPVRSNRSGAKEEENTTLEKPRALRAVHIGGRQQLCINAGIRKASGGRTEVLNDMCLAAMRYEHSKAGRAARKAANKQHAAGLVLASAAATKAAAPPVGALGDIEDLGTITTTATTTTTMPATAGAIGKDQGCAYCATSKLKALLAHVKANEHQPASQQHEAGQAPSPSSHPLSMEQMRALGEELGACPYLASRLLVRGADVVFVPYGYLASEDLRSSLLGGVATNPISEKEEEEEELRRAESDRRKRKMTTDREKGEDEDEDEDEEGWCASGSPPSLGAVLYQRRQRAMASFRNSAKRGPPGGNGRPSPKADDALLGAAGKAPNLCGDVVVLDEAHNIVDYCRSISTCRISLEQLRLVQHLLTAYLQRYEGRLLTKNKQRLREIIFFAGKLLAYGAQQLGPVGERGEEGGSRCCVLKNFPSLVFEAGVDHVDVYPLLLFLVDSRLSVKLLGLVPFLLAQEEQSAQTLRQDQLHAARLARLDQARRQHRDATRNPARPTRGGDEEQHSPRGEASHDTPPQPLTALFHPLLGGGDVSDAVAQGRRFSSNDAVAVTARAMEAFESFLRSLYISDSSSSSSSSGGSGQDGGGTQILFERDARAIVSSSATPSSPPAARKLTTTMKVVQLEPGVHTLGPVIKAAKGVILAGGTMQPLALSCGLLLPPAHTGKAEEAKITLITEPHVVSSSSIAVWALPCGPSGRRLEFSQHALTGGGRQQHPSSSPVAPHPEEDAAFTELAMTLLNFARVLPPAGVICFFTSYEAERRFHDFLVRRGLLDSINDVKRIFREAASAGAAKGEKGSGTVEDMLDAYKKWIYGDTSEHCGDRRGALLFAVMGGKLSEGINFADDLGRAVLVVGLPYANLADPELRLFLHHVAGTRLCGGSNRSSSSSSGKGASYASLLASGDATLSHEEWSLYTDMCMRTVNQCVGRCIRHINDYAAVVLLDARYAERADVRRRVSGWMQPSMRVASSFGECFRGVRGFFEERAKAHPS